MTITSLNISDGTVSRKVLPQLKRRYVVGTIIVIAIIALILILYFSGAFSKHKGSELWPPNPEKALPPSASKLHTFRKAAVCADSAICAEVGRKILERNGTAVDSVLATALCNGVYTMQSMGIGGGFLMTIYKKEENRAYTLIAREKAPLAAKPDMYKDDHKASQKGPLSIGVPGELRGYKAAHDRFGRLPWKEIVQPSIEICENGFEMSQHQFMSLHKNDIRNDSNLREWFVNEITNEFHPQGSRIKPKKLCETLKIIAEKGADDFYTGELSKKILEDLKDIGSIIEAKDLEEYKADWEEPVSVKLMNGDRLHSVPPPGSGVILAYIMNILNGYGFNRSSVEDLNSTVLSYHRIAEAFKYAYAKRTELGDIKFLNISQLLKNLTDPTFGEYTRSLINDSTTYNDAKHYGGVTFQSEDHGTSHISILAEDGDAVSFTSTVNIYFGAGLTSRQTGVLFNSVMDDFSFPYFENYFGLPGSPNNELKPGKRPLSSMTPTIITDRNGDVKMVVGASGGTRITTSIAWVIIKALWFGDNIKEAVDSPRMHHQLLPMLLEYEYGMLQQIVAGLEALGHKTKRNSASVVCAMIKDALRIIANADHRKGGDVFGID